MLIIMPAWSAGPYLYLAPPPPPPPPTSLYYTAQWKLTLALFNQNQLIG